MRSLLLVAAAVSLASGLGAQSPDLRRGARVRVGGAGSPSVVGVVVVVTNDSLVVASSESDSPVSLRRASLDQIEVSTGTRRHARTGLVLGTVVGGVTGLVAGYAAGDDTCVPRQMFDCMFTFSAEGKALLGGATLGTLGAIFGTIAGALTKTERWVTVTRTVSAAPIVDARGRVGLSLQF